MYLKLLDDAAQKDLANHILSLQDPDGSFAYTGKAGTSIYLTSEIILFLSDLPEYFAAGEACEDAGSYLLSVMNPDGSIGEHLYETLAAARALLKTSAMTSTQKDSLYSYIYGQQAANGEFGNNAFATAMGLDLLSGAAPNLGILKGSMELSNQAPQIGETVSLTAVVENKGDMAAENISVKLYNCASAGNCQLLGETSIPTLSSRSSTSINIDFSINSTGIQDLRLELDGSNIILEQDESDNTAEIEINAVDGVAPVVSNVSVDYEYISPNGDNIQDIAAISFELSEDAAVSLEVVDREGFSYPATAAVNLIAGVNEIIWDGRREDGVLVADGRYAVRVLARDESGNMGVGLASVVVDTNSITKTYSYEKKSLTALIGDKYKKIWTGRKYENIHLTTSSNAKKIIIKAQIVGWSRTPTNIIPSKIIDIESGNEILLTSNFLDEAEYQCKYGYITGAQFSHDNTKAFLIGGGTTCNMESSDIMVVNSDGSGLKPLVVGYYRIHKVSWGHDNKTIFFTADIAGDSNLYRVDTNTGLIDLIDERYISNFQLSPNGNYIFYTAIVTVSIGVTRRETKRILLNLENGQMIDLEGAGYIYDWSNDGNKIITTANNFRSGYGRRLLLIDLKNAFVLQELECAYRYGIHEAGAHFKKDNEVFFACRDSFQPHAPEKKFEFYLYSIDSGVTEYLLSGDIDYYYNIGSWLLWLYRNKYGISPNKQSSIYFSGYDSGLPHPTQTNKSEYYLFNFETFESQLLFDEFDIVTLDGGVPIGHPEWLHDGSGILFHLDDDGNSRFSPVLYEFTPEETYFAKIDAVAPLTNDRCVVEVTGIAANSNFSYYRLEYKTSNEPSSEWTLITEGTQQVVNDILAEWYVCGLPEGQYELRLTVTDKAGNVTFFGGSGSDVESNQIALICTGGGAPHIEYSFYLEASPSIFAGLNGPDSSYVFSPNDDGVLDTTPFGYTLKGLARVSAWVTDAQSNVVKSFLTDETQDIASYSYEWDGTDDNGATVADGDYIIHLLDNYVPTQPEEISFSAKVDVTPPTITVNDPMPGALISGRQDITGTVDDANFREYSVQTRKAGENNWISVNSGQESIADDSLLTWDTTGLNGDYQLRISVTDLGANSNELVLTYHIDNTAPSAWITEPEDAAVNNIFTVAASTDDQDVDAVKFEIKADNEIEWTELATVSTPFEINLDSAEYNHGYYNLRAIAIDHVGNTDSDPEAITFLIDKVAPTSWITSPGTDEYVRGVVEISAESYDLDLAHIKFYYRTATQASWEFLSMAFAGASYSATLDVSGIADGYIYLRSIAADTGGLVEANPASRRLIVDNTAPTASIIFPGEGDVIGGAYDIVGSASDKNIISYALAHRKSGTDAWKPVGEWAVAAPGVTDSSLAEFDTRSLVGGDYELMLKALDRAGNSSTFIAVVSIENQAPRVTDISANHYVSLSELSAAKILDINYTLTEPAHLVKMELLNASGAPLLTKSAGFSTAAGTNSYGYDCRDADGGYLMDGTYTARIIASDEFDNTNSAAITFIADSTPPVLAITQPAAADDVFGKIEIRGSVEDENFDSYSIFYSAEGSVNGWILVDDYSELPSSDLLGSFDAVNFEGNYNIKITARDKADNLAVEAIIPVTVHDSSSPIEKIALSHEFINFGALNISFDLKRAASISVEVLDAAQRHVKTIDAGVLGSGGHTVGYGLDDDLLALVGDGAYSTLITVEDSLTGRSAIHDAGIFVIDATLPTAEITSPTPNDQLAASQIVEGLAADENFEQYKLMLGVGASPSQWIDLSKGFTPPLSTDLGFFDVSELQGTYTIKLWVKDLAGNENSHNVAVQVPAGASAALSGVLMYPAVISPNGDGVQDQAFLEYVLNQGSDVSIEIDRREIDDSLTPVRVLWSASTDPMGQKQYAWDGTDDEGLLVPDGIYHILVKTTDPATLVQRELNCGSVVVDTLPPVFSITEPMDLDTVIDTVNVRISLVELNPSEFMVEYKAAGASPSSPSSLIAQGGHFSDHLPLARWNTASLGGLSGDYNLIVSVSDLGGNVAQESASVFIEDARVPLLSNVGLSNRVISPNADGIKDQTILSFSLSRKGRVSAAIKDQDGAAIKTIADNETMTLGNYALIFDGTNDSGSITQDGEYSFEVVVFDPLRSSATTNKEPITVDAAPPVLTIASPKDGAYVPSIFNVEGQIIETGLAEFTLSHDSAGFLVEKSITTDPSGAFSEQIDSQRTNGSIVLSFFSLDDGGNETRKKITAYLDNTPPEVSLSLAGGSTSTRTSLRTTARRLARVAEPAAGYPILGGDVVLSYTATDANIKSVSLEYAKEQSPDAWTSILESSSNAFNSLCNFDTSALTDGIYLIRLSAADQAENKNSTVITVELDNTPPIVEITSPLATKVITGPTKIEGSVLDHNLLSYQVKLGLDVASGDVLGSYGRQVENSLLHDWTPGAVEGERTLAVEAVDAAGNRTTTTLLLMMDTVKPLPPMDLVVSLNQEKQPVLAWTPGAEPDLFGYKIYRSETAIGSAAAANYIDIDEISGLHSYHATAVDQNGNESDPSNIVSINIDKTGPFVQITSPGATGVYSGLLVVKGSAKSSDFYSYTLEVKEGADTSPWETIRSSPTAKDDQVLGFYNSSDFDGLATLKLTGEDTSGNESVATVLVNIDNVPPASPQGFAATVQGTNNIIFSWTPNTELDLAGYRLLLYGNSIDPALTTTTSHEYANAPDGQYTFSLVAVDEAGNESLPTFPVAVTLNNKVPSISIKSPANGEVVSKIDEPLLITADLPEYDIVLVRFQYKADSETEWLDIGTPIVTEILGTPDKPIQLGEAGIRLDVSGFSDGVYNLRAISTDKANQSDPAPPESSIELRAAPLAPVGLSAVFSAGTVNLSWIQNTELDLAGYKIYRNDSAAGQVGASATAFTEAMALDGIYSYSLSAFDALGNESAKCSPVDVVVDATAPAITLTAPAEGSQVKGVVAITGTIDEANPGIISLDICNGTVLSSCSPLTTINGEPTSTTLHTFLSTDYSDNTYTIKATAVDAFANAAIPATRLIAIDNNPPDAPTNLAAVATADAGVDLSWAPVIDASPLTYKIYERTAGASYTLMGTTDELFFHAGEGLKVGVLYSFVVTAMDSAGNESGYSANAEAAIIYTLPPNIPTIYYPANSISSFITGNNSEDIIVWAKTNTSVSLKKDGETLDSTMASSTNNKALIYENIGNEHAISPDGANTAFLMGGYLYIRDNSSGIEAKASDEYIGNSTVMSWAPKSLQLAYLNGKTIKLFDLGSWETSVISDDSSKNKYSLDWSPNEEYLAALCHGSPDYQKNIWLFPLGGGALIQQTFDAATESNLSWSPDGSTIAYESSQKIYRVDLETGSIAQVSPSYGNSPSFSPNGKHIAYAYQDSLYVKNIASGSLAVMQALGMPQYAKWAPHGQEILFASASNSKITAISYDFNSETFTESVDYGSFFENNTKRQSSWLSDGRILAYSIDANQPKSYFVIEPENRFVFKNIPVAQGENIFTAFASNSMGERSELSLPVTIIYDPSIAQPTGVVSDLFVMADRLFIVPNAPVKLNETMIQASVMNASDQSREAVFVRFMVRDPSGIISQIGDDVRLQEMQPGEDRIVLFWWTPQVHGAHEIFITVDPENQVPESDETNNSLAKSINVGRSEISGTLLLTAADFNANEDVSIKVLLSNKGFEALSVSCEVTVEDALGNIFSTIASNSAALTANGLSEREFIWNTGNILAGQHIMRLRVFGEDGELLAEDKLEFTVLSSTGISASLILDKTSYIEGDAANITVTVKNLSPNMDAQGVVFELSVKDDQAIWQYNEVKQMVDIFASSSIQQNVAVILPVGNTGTYTAHLTVFQHGVSSAIIIETFEVNQKQRTLFEAADGSISAPQWKIKQGSSLSLYYRLTNTGGLDFQETAATVELVNPVKELVVKSIPLSISLAIEESTTDTLSLGEINESLGSYMVLFTMILNGERVVLDQTGFELVDMTPPSVSILSPGASHYKGDPLVISVRVTDDVKGVASAEFMIGGKTGWMPLNFETGNDLDGTYGATVDVSSFDEGIYKISIRASDKAGNNWTTLSEDMNPLDAWVEIYDLARVEIEPKVIPRVLVWSNDREGQSSPTQYDRTFTGDPKNEPNNVRLYLRSLLDNGYDFKIVQSAAAFLHELRTGYYNIFVINDRLKTPKATDYISTAKETSIARELRELSNAGAGVIISDYIRFNHTLDDSLVGDSYLEDLIGAQLLEVDNHRGLNLDLAESELGPALTAKTGGRPVVVVPKDAETMGVLSPPSAKQNDIPGLISNTNGKGKVLFAAFSISKSDDGDERNAKDFDVYEQFFLDALSFVAPSYEELYAGSGASFALNVEAFDPCELKIELSAPTQAVNLIAYQGGAVDGNSVEWSKSYIEGDADNIEFSMSLPKTNAVHDILANISFLRDEIYQPLTSLAYGLDLSETHADLVIHAIALLQAMDLPANEETIRNELVASLTTIAGSDMTTCASVEQLIVKLLDEVDELENLNVDTSEVRLLLDASLKIIQRMDCQ